jgi:flagellar biosynthesis/type III secretory pathway M-ring protein FliF/YscJ
MTNLSDREAADRGLKRPTEYGRPGETLNSPRSDFSQRGFNASGLWVVAIIVAIIVIAIAWYETSNRASTNMAPATTPTQQSAPTPAPPPAPEPAKK